MLYKYNVLLINYHALQFTIKPVLIIYLQSAMNAESAIIALAVSSQYTRVAGDNTYGDADHLRSIMVIDFGTRI